MIAARALLQEFLQAAPGLSGELFQWVTNNGLAVVFLFAFFGLFSWLIRTVMGSLVKQVTNAVTYFTGKLDAMSARSEAHQDAVDARIARMIETQNDVATRIVEAMAAQTAVIHAQGELLAAMNESIRIQLNFTTQQMTQQATLTQQVQQVAAHAGVSVAPNPNIGVVKPVQEGRTEDADRSGTDNSA